MVPDSSPNWRLLRLGPFFDVLSLGADHFSEIKKSHIVRGDLTRFFKVTVFAAFLQVWIYEAAKGVERPTTTHWRQVLPPQARAYWSACSSCQSRLSWSSLEYITAPMEGTGGMSFEVP